MTARASARDRAAAGHRRRRIRGRRGRSVRLPHVHGHRLALPAGLGHLYGAAAIRRNPGQRLRVPGDELELRQLRRCLQRGELPTHSISIRSSSPCPAVIVTLIVASMVAFAVSRFSWRFNLLLLMVFTAGNLLPQQVIIVPLYRLYLLLPLPATAERQRTDLRLVLRDHPDPHRLPDSASACSSSATT